MNKVQQKRLIRIIAIIVILFMSVNILLEVVNTVKTKYNISQARQENNKLKKEESNLKTEIERLKDDKYIQSYVSGTIFSTEKGTTVYVLPKEQEKAPE